MAGDRIHTSIDYYYTAANTSNSGADGITSLLTNLASAIMGSPATGGILKDAATDLTNALSGNAGLISLLNTPNETSSSNQAPKAYLNILFFNEQFKFDENASVVVPVSYTPGTKGTISKLASNAVQAKKNGYVYVYFSNESEELVFFDNFKLSHERGRILEETHYYAFGLIQAGISSKALINKIVFNNKKFNGIEYATDLGLHSYDAFFRNADSQIGRWWEIDPKQNVFESPYSMMGNNPILNADPLGDTVRGTSNKDARRLQRIIRQTFKGKEMRAVRQMFQRRLHAGDKKTFAGISQWQVNQATAKLTSDQRSLVEGYVDAINSTEVHTVEVVKRGETLKDANSIRFGDRTGADVDVSSGGGFNMLTASGSHSVIVMNSRALIPDYRDNNSGNPVHRMTSSRGELLAHELLGHGLSNFNSGGSQFLNAIQLTNLYHRVTGTGNLYRDGTSHGGTTGVPLPYSQASGVPVYLQQTNIHFMIHTIRTFLRIL